MCRRALVLHELLHTLLPEQMHGRVWRQALTELWQREFDVPAAFSIAPL
ncbi:MAG: hypothetical protein WA446_02750 [Steroidobacteraceae bacterium]